MWNKSSRLIRDLAKSSSHGHGNKLSQTFWREKYKLSFSKDKWACANKIFANTPPKNLLE